MTERYLGSIISPSPVEPSEGFADSTASGVWNVHDPLIFGQAGDWPDPTVASPSKFIENLFSCFKYTGNSGSQTITNGIDLSNEGGLVWVKCRNSAENNRLFDTERGATYYLTSNSTAQHYAGFNQAFTSSGFSFNSDDASVNENNNTYISWTFRKQPKFFDVVTYTGDGNTSQAISHNLGSTPGFILAKQTDGTGSWFVYHRSMGATKYLNLESTGGGPYDQTYVWNDTEPTSTHFTVGNDQDINESGESYVAYLFAHNNDDGGFGSTGDQDIIKCGTFDTNSDGDASVTLGFEPQWLIVKRSDGVGNWTLLDNIRHWDRTWWNPLYADVTNAESGFAASRGWPTSTGFEFDGQLSASATYIYVAIRRGPMKAPTAATSVFNVQTYTGNNTTHRKFTTNFVVDANITSGFTINDRTCWGARFLDGMHETSQTAVSYYNLTDWIDYDHNDGYDLPSAYQYSNTSSRNYVSYSFSRAPKFFDIVTYAGASSSNRAVAHNLEVAPELIIIKSIANADNWRITTTDAFPDGYTFGSGQVQSGVSAFSGASTPNATNFYVSNDGEVNSSGRTYIAYLFATLAGISKVGTYSGTGNDVNVDCGFTNGARFVLVKRKDSSGDWYHWDSESGIVAGNDPYLLLNSDAAQVTNTDYIDPLSSGFTITSNAGSDLNTSGGTYLFLAIA